MAKCALNMFYIFRPSQKLWRQHFPKPDPSPEPKLSRILRYRLRYRVHLHIHQGLHKFQKKMKYNKKGNITFYICQVNTRVCQVRLDFVEFVVGPPISNTVVRQQDKVERGKSFYIVSLAGIAAILRLSRLLLLNKQIQQNRLFKRVFSVEVTKNNCCSGVQIPEPQQIM